VSEAVTLERFYAAMGRFFADPSDAAIEALRAEFPGWEPAPERLGIYGYHARIFLEKMLAKVFGGVRDALGSERWAAVMADYYATRPATHFEINEGGRGFPDHLAGQADVPEWVPPLARLEWAVFDVSRDPEEVPDSVERLMVNPTLVTVEHEWKLCPWLARDPRSGEPAREDELALVWRNPYTMRGRYQSGGPRPLLAVKIALEGIPLERAAAEGGVDAAAIEAVVADALRHGLLLGPDPASTAGPG